MSLRGFSIKDFKENIFYHIVENDNFNKEKVYFIKDDILYEMKKGCNPKVSQESFNFINNAEFVKAYVSTNIKQLPKWTKVEALIDDKWVKRYFYSYEKDAKCIVGLGELIKEDKILVTPCSKEMFDNKFVEYTKSIRFDERDGYKALTWS